MDAIEKWGLDCLMRGCIGTEGAWETSIETQKIQESLAATAGMAGSKTHATDAALGMKLTKSVAELNKVRGSKTMAERLAQSGSRPYSYVLPPLEDCRKQFENVMGLAFEWPDHDGGHLQAASREQAEEVEILRFVSTV